MDGGGGAKAPPLRALVTGGAGFIGSHLAERLAAEGVEVVILDDFSQGRRENLAWVKSPGLARLVEADARDADAVGEAARGCQWIFHLAAMNSIARSIAEPWRSHSVNVGGTLNVLAAARQAGVQRVLFASSSSVYGDIAAEIKHEEMTVRPLAPYPLQKFAGEQYAALFTRLHGLETVSLRLFNVFGPRQRADGDYAAAIPRFCAAVRAGRRPLVFGDGSQARDFTHVSNVTEAFLTVARAPDSAVAGRVFNVGAGRAVTLLELAREINSACGTSLAPEFAPARVGEVYRTQADISALLAVGYQPQTTFRDGLRALAAGGL